VLSFRRDYVQRIIDPLRQEKILAIFFKTVDNPGPVLMKNFINFITITGSVIAQTVM